jgi:hypothetical protein
MYTSPQEFPFAILYFTGSKAFNTVMRGEALKQGMSLNEHGLYKKQPGKEKEDKVAQTFATEADVFNYLKIQYKEPTERIDGRAVVKLGDAAPTLTKEQLVKEEEKQQTRKLVEPKKKRTLKIREGEPIVVNTKPPSPKKSSPKVDIPIVPVIPMPEQTPKNHRITIKVKPTKKTEHK